ncbi:MAG: exo-alpha-sialidase [Acidobacteria bacterium]|nr:exo-alpha-sialidase [Acidobacteriota bacterium]
MLRKRTWVATLIFCEALLSQQPSAPADAPKPEAPARPVYAFSGKPLNLQFACSDDDIMAFGLTCAEDEPCEVYLELAALESVGGKVFLTGNLHTRDATMWSVLLGSEDGGKTWTELFERMRSTGLEQIQFIDFEMGWIGGQQLLALPRDPFFLITDDGGKTWRRKPLYSETRVGAIEQFAFESRTVGQLLIDRTQSGESGGRHEFYETNSGGDSWSLRQVSPNPIKLRRPRTPNPDWRIRPDARSKSFVIERRSAGSWHALSSFLVKAGECKPAELKFTDPPPEPEPSKTEAPPPPPPSGSRRPPTLKKKP